MLIGYGIMRGKKIRNADAVVMVAERQRDLWNGTTQPDRRVTLKYSPNGNPEYYYPNGVVAGGYQ